MKTFAQKVLAFFGMVFAGLCWIYGLMFGWSSLFTLIWPETYLKHGKTIETELLFLFSSLVCLIVGYVVGKASGQVFNPNSQKLKASALHGSYLDKGGRRGRI